MTRPDLISIRSWPAGALAVLAGTALVTLAAGCSRSDDTSKAVKKASGDVHVIGGGGGPAATVAFENRQYSDAIATLTPVADRGLDEEKAAALVIIAQSQMGLAAEPAGKSADLERECLDRMTVIRSLLGDWLTNNARAAALDQFDPAPTLTEIATNIAGKDTLVAEQRRAKAALDAQIADLRTQATQRATEAAAEENTYAQLKARSATVSAVQAEPLVREAAQHKHRSDELRNAGALLEARAEQLDRQAAESALLIDQYTNQKKNYEATSAGLREKLSTSKTEAAAARAEAQKAAARLDALLTELRTLRSGPLVEASDKAVKGYRDAVASARKAAAGDSNGGSKLTLGAAEQAAGDGHWARAQGLGAYAQFVDSLAKAQPPLPKAAEYAKEAAEAAAARIEALKAAEEAYGAAKDAYASVRSRGESKDRLEQLSKSTAKIEEALAKMAKGEAVDLSAELRAAEKPTADAAAAAPPTPDAGALPAGVPPQLAAAVEKLLRLTASRNFAGMLELMYFPPGTEAVKAPFGALAASTAKLDAACRAKFGAGVEEALKSIPGAGAMGSLGGAGAGGLTPEAAGALKLADLQITMSGDRASVVVPGTPTPLTFVKSGEAWLMDAGLGSVTPEMLQQQAAIFGPLGTAFEELAGEVEAGKFQTIQAVGVGFMQKMQGIMGALQGQGKGPGGG